MKIRKGFVTNSSSSSYICEICEEVVSGYDMGLEEAGMVECEAGHTFCVSHIDEAFNRHTNYADMCHESGYDILDYVTPEILLAIGKNESVGKVAETLEFSEDFQEIMSALELACSPGKVKGKKQAKEFITANWQNIRNRIMLLKAQNNLATLTHDYQRDRAWNIMKAIEENDSDTIIDYIKEGFDYYSNIPIELCPICQRKKVSSHEREKYMLALLKKSRADINKMILEQDRDEFLSIIYKI